MSRTCALAASLTDSRSNGTSKTTTSDLNRLSFIVLPSSRTKVITGAFSDPDLHDVISTGSAENANLVRLCNYVSAEICNIRLCNYYFK
ncbi:hypothetical protein EON65_54175 [archaeon]|nr:MAG: hypothetical protein EON65_54175 [archaeon]